MEILPQTRSWCQSPESAYRERNRLPSFVDSHMWNASLQSSCICCIAWCGIYIQALGSAVRQPSEGYEQLVWPQPRTPEHQPQSAAIRTSRISCFFQQSTEDCFSSGAIQESSVGRVYRIKPRSIDGIRHYAKLACTMVFPVLGA